MPPEQWRPDSTLGTGADIYAFGVMLYVALTGFCPLPFAPSATPEDFRRIHETEPYQPLSDLSPRREEILEALDAVIGRCLEKDVRRRWPDFGVVFAELESLYRRFIGSPWSDCTSQSPIMTSHVMVRQGQMALARGDAQAALEKAERILGAAEAVKDLDSIVVTGSDLALSLKQNALFAMERYQDALEVNDQLLGITPHNSTIHLSRVDILEALGLEEELAECWARAASSLPENPEILGGYGYFLINRGRYEEAVEMLTRAVQNKPDDTTLRTLRARALLHNKRLGAAMTEVEQLLGTEADYVQLFMIRATGYLALELNQLAEQTAQDGLFMDPENQEAQEIQSLAQSREQPGETDPSVLRRMAGERANEYLRSEQYDEAEDWALLALAFEHHPDEGNLLVIALLMREELAQAEIIARDLCDRYPERPDCWYNLAQTLVLNDEKTEARTILERLREFDPDDELVNRLHEEIN
jgi:tetratricopeptide (TPR) repeat protein